MPDENQAAMVINNDEEAAAAEQAAANYRARQAEAAAAARGEKLAPLRAITTSEAYAKLCDDLGALVRSAAYVDEDSIDVHLRAAFQVLPGLRNAVG